MPTVDFTLNDFQAIIDQSIERALVKERGHTRAMVTEMLEANNQKLKGFMAYEFSSFWDNNLAPVLEEMQDDIKVIKDIVKDHGFRISRLESRPKP